MSRQQFTGFRLCFAGILLVLLLGVFVDTPVSSSTNAASFFQITRIWHDNFCYGQEECRVGDFNGDGMDDIMALVRRSSPDPNRGNVWVALSNGNGFGQPSVWHSNFCNSDWPCEVGDINGDGMDDLISLDFSLHGEPEMALSRGDRFSQDGTKRVSSSYNSWVGNLHTALGFSLADVSNRGYDQLVGFRRGSDVGRGEVWMYQFARGSDDLQHAFGAKWHDYFCLPGALCATGDFDGDGRADIIEFQRQSGDASRHGHARVSLSDGERFGPALTWHHNLCDKPELICRIGDFDGDGRDDVFIFYRSSDPQREGHVWVSTSNGIQFSDPFPVHYSFCYGHEICDVGDFNGDGLADLVAFTRGDTGNVWVALTERHVVVSTWPALASATPTAIANTGIQSTERTAVPPGATGQNMALGQPVTASNSLPDNPPQFVNDGNHSTVWNSGGGPEQWVTVSIQPGQVVRSIQLVVAQDPSVWGWTVHQIIGGGSAFSGPHLLHEFRGVTHDGQVLTYTPPQPLEGYTYFKIVTTESSSWVAWAEIEILD